MAERNVLVDGGVDNVRTLASGDTAAGLTRPLFNRFANATTTTTAQETTWSNTIAAGTFVSDGGTVRFVYAGTTTANANEKDWNLQFNGNVLIQVNYLANVGDWRIEGTLIRASNTEVRCFSQYTTGNGSEYPMIDYVELTGLNLTTTGYALALKLTTTDTAGNITAKFTQATYSTDV